MRVEQSAGVEEHMLVSHRPHHCCGHILLLPLGTTFDNNDCHYDDDYLDDGGDAQGLLGNHDGHFAYDDFDANIYRLLFDDARGDCHYDISASIYINCLYEIIYLYCS